MIVEVTNTYGLWIPDELVTTDVMQALLTARVLHSQYVDGYKWFFTDDKFTIDPISEPLYREPSNGENSDN